jgi:hypothetical protein
MAFIGDDVLDAACNEVATGTALHICSQEPATYAEASSTYTLGNKSSPGFTGPANGDVSGRKIAVDAIADGSVTGTDTATHWAIVDGSALLAAGALDSSQSVTSGNTFTLTSFDIEFPDPA